MATIVGRHTGAVTEHEREIVSMLLEELPDEYRVIPNLCLAERAGGQVYEYDIVVVSPHAVYVVEAKCWYGTVRALNRSEWKLSGGKVVRNPHLVNDQKARVLVSVLQQLDFTDRAGRRLRTPWVQGCFVAGSNDTVLEPLEDDYFRTLTPAGLIEYLQHPHLLSTRSPALANTYLSHVEEIANHIYGVLDEQEEGQRVFGNYVVDETIDQSDDNSVYLAHHASLPDGQLYRVRTWFVSAYRFDEEEREKRVTTLRRSADALSKLEGHANIVSLVDFGEADGVFYEVTRWSDRGTLSASITLGGPRRLETSRKLDLLLGIARGLAAAREVGVFHRDLNPEAILLGPDGTPQIADFDRAFLEDANHTVFASTEARGINPYQPPELKKASQAEVFDNTDLYSLAAIAYDLFTSMPPTRSKDGDTWRFPKLSSQAHIEAEIAERLDELMLSMLSDEPSERPETPSEVVTVLTELIEILSPDSRLPVSQGEAARSRASSGEPDEQLVRQAAGIYEAGEIIAESNRVISLLGHGATSRVYEVSNDYAGEMFALKLFDPASETDPNTFLRAFNILRAITHPHIVRVQWGGQARDPLGSDKGLPYLLMERLDGDALSTLLSSDSRPTVAEVLAWGEQLLGALVSLHDEEIIHRDVKPDNIIITSRGAVLTDFGSATREPTNTSLEGTLRYTPPDISERGWSSDADTFALGCVLYEALTGEMPWPGAPNDAHPPKPLGDYRLDDIPSMLADVIMKSLSAARSERYQNAREFLTAWKRASIKPPETRFGPNAVVSRALEKNDHELWTLEFATSLITHDHLLVPVYSALSKACMLREEPFLEEAWLSAEARAMKLENPLTEVMPSVYDALLEQRSPLAIDADPDAQAAPLLLGARDRLLVLDRLSHIEVCWLQSALAPSVSSQQFFWCAGPTGHILGEVSTDLEHVFQDIPTEHLCAADLPSFIEALTDSTTRVLQVELPVGQRGDDGFAALLERRRGLLRSLIEHVRLSTYTTWITTRAGVMYLGHGLRRDVGAALGSTRGDLARRQWSATFGTERFVETSTKLEAGVYNPTRQVGETLFPVGRLAWPDPANAPRLAVGGVSLMERLLPILKCEPAKH